METQNDFILYWNTLNETHGRVMYETDENEFYIYRSGVGEHIVCSPVKTPTLVQNISSENLIDIMTYVIRNIKEKSTENQEKINDFSTNNQKNTNDFTKNNQNNSNPLKVNSNYNINFLLNKNDKLLNACNELSARIQKQNKSKRNKSAQKAMILAQFANAAHIAKDTEELTFYFDRLKGLHTTVKTAKQNRATGIAKAKRNRYYKIAGVISVFVIIAISVPIYYLFQPEIISQNEISQNENFNKTEIINTQSEISQSTVAIDTIQVMKLISIYETEMQIEISQWRKNEILKAISKNQDKSLLQVIELINSKYSL